ncbi:helix-turn-helix domain-containing protein [Aestuariicella sp. G3-2]|uniref:helix-turn-helix domain-containing protein n=1 Tax=Pseudomaricurvus albidus TaxID=2842452 RepID=UPI001C0CFA35|nr:helix-turn-helix transcriptional regulator [Aestuariicella albida]MBU3070940.1 helix-turn-helix domain-containing protein [Aestuariicella albida]
MTAPKKTADENDHSIHFGQLLRFWRNVHKISQEELAARIDSASRHISRLEKGAAQPSKDMVIRIADALNLGIRDTTNLLFSAGYINLNHSFNLTDPELSHRREEIVIGLKALDPNPAVAVDMSGDILMVNKAWVGFQAQLDTKGTLGKSKNLFEFLFSYVESQNLDQDWGGTLSVLMLSLQQRLYFHGDKDNKISRLLEQLQASPYLPDNWQQQAASRFPGLTFRFNVILNNKPQSFLIHSYIENLLGPLAYTATPDILVSTFCAEDATLELPNFVNHNLNHPLLHY